LANEAQVIREYLGLWASGVVAEWFT
jgi:hypothetical protein